MLPLYGIADDIRGFDPQNPRHIIRLRKPNQTPEDTADAALIHAPCDVQTAAANGFAGAVMVGKPEALPGNVPVRTVRLPDKFSYLSDGDILGIHPASKRFRTLYRRESKHNSFLVTERCNHYCLMCSQPPRDIDDRWILQEIRRALPLVDKQTRSLGFTGGEPLLDWKDLIATLEDCRDILPETAIHVLSNGRAFASSEVAAAWAAARHPNLTVGIPVYAAVDSIHDYVVQAKGAFDETVLGVLKLKDKGQRWRYVSCCTRLRRRALSPPAAGSPATCPLSIMSR